MKTLIFICILAVVAADLNAQIVPCKFTHLIFM